MDSTMTNHVGKKTEEHPIKIEPWSFLPNIQFGMVGHNNLTITELDVTKIKTKTNDELDIHSPSAALIHDGEKTYFCNNYGKKFTSPLKNHQFSHTRNSTEIDNVEVKIEEYPIQIEPLSFQPIIEKGMVAHFNSRITLDLEVYNYKNESQTTEQLDNHSPRAAWIHAGKKSYYCNHCGKNFTTNTLLQKHQFIHTRDKTLQQCSLSFKSYVKNDLFKIYHRKHIGEKPFHCNHCDKAFSIKSNFVKHQMIHTGKKPFQCSHCDQAFIFKSYLVKHQIIHTGEKPFQCSHCDKSFAIKGNLVSHNRIHTGEKPYNCNHCDKAVASKASLVEHQRTHTGEKPFQCSHCDKSFTIKGNLVSHKRRHTGEKPYNCNHCGKAFSHKCNLAQHHRTHNVKK